MSHRASWSADPQAGSFEFSLRIEILSFNTETIFEQAAIEIQIESRQVPVNITLYVSTMIFVVCFA